MLSGRWSRPFRKRSITCQPNRLEVEAGGRVSGSRLTVKLRAAQERHPKRRARTLSSRGRVRARRSRAPPTIVERHPLAKPPHTTLASSQQRAQKILKWASRNHCSDDAPFRSIRARSQAVHQASGRAVSASSPQKKPTRSPRSTAKAMCSQTSPMPCLPCNRQSMLDRSSFMAHNGEVEGAPRSAHQAPRPHTVFQHPQHHTDHALRTPPAIVRQRT